MTDPPWWIHDARYHRQLAAYFPTRYTPLQLQVVARLRHLFFVVPDTRDWGHADHLRFAVNDPDGNVRSRIGAVEVPPSKQFQPQLVWALDGQPIGFREDRHHLIVDVWPRNDVSTFDDDDLAAAVRIDALIESMALDDAYARWSGPGVIDPVQFPEVFAPPPYGPL